MHNKNYLCREINGNVHIIKESELVKRASVYGVIVSEDKILLVKDRTSEDKWDLPGGGLELNEDLIQALHREIKEETGITLTQKPELICEFIEYFYDIETNKGWESTRSFFSIVWEGEPIFEGNMDDIVECKFFEKNLESKEVAPVAREIVSMLLKQ
ncbi:MAG: NUDIX domain-containing protein [bacterium]|nr:NUDIX domain-containing protein [bacterium]